MHAIIVASINLFIKTSSTVRWPKDVNCDSAIDLEEAAWHGFSGTHRSEHCDERHRQAGTAGLWRLRMCDVHFMVPKRRFCKELQKMKIVFSMFFSRVWALDLLHCNMQLRTLRCISHYRQYQSCRFRSCIRSPTTRRSRSATMRVTCNCEMRTCGLRK